MELGAVLDERDLMAIARVVEGRPAGHAESQSAADHGDPADHLPARVAKLESSPTGMKSISSAAAPDWRKRVTSTLVSGQ